MRRSFQTCRPADPLSLALQRMREDDEDSILVVDDRGRAVGAVTYATAEASEREPEPGSPPPPTVGDVMTGKLVTCSPNDDARRIGARLVAQDTPMALVVAADQIVGVMTFLDLGRAFHRSRDGHRFYPFRRRGHSAR